MTDREVHPKEKYIAVDEHGFLQLSSETSGYDYVEGVYKVANYVWDTDSLAWVRATQDATGGSGTTTVATKAKRFDQASASTLYIGEADPGTATSSPSWKIKRVTFSAGGDPTAIEYAAVGAATQIWDNRVALSYS
jgi:hypothetical protein